MQNSSLLISSNRISFIRYFSKSVINYAQYTTVERILRNADIFKIYPHTVMYKLLFRKKKKDPFNYHMPSVGTPNISLQSAVETVTPQHIPDSKRIKVLNKLFMRYIPEILMTSDVAPELWNYNVVISRVKMTLQFHILDVFWIPNGTDDDETIQRILNNIAYPLRTELIRLRLMGLVPKIRFQKEPKYAIMLEIDRRLKMADYGEDYIPTNVLGEINLKKDLQLQIQLPEEIRRKIITVEKCEPLSADEKRDIPPMQMRVFGLHYDHIMNSIQDNMKKAPKVDHLSTTVSLIGESAIKEVPFSTETQELQNWNKAAFLRFLRKQRIKEKKNIKMQRREMKIKLAEENYCRNDDELLPVDELYSEFVEFAFHDELEDDFVESDSISKYENEQ